MRALGVRPAGGDNVAGVHGPDVEFSALESGRTMRKSSGRWSARKREPIKNDVPRHRTTGWISEREKGLGMHDGGIASRSTVDGVAGQTSEHNGAHRVDTEPVHGSVAVTTRKRGGQ